MDNTGWRTAPQNRRCFQNSGEAQGLQRAGRGPDLVQVGRGEAHEIDWAVLSPYLCVCPNLPHCLPGKVPPPWEHTHSAHCPCFGNGTFQSILMAQEGPGSSNLAEDHQSRLRAVRIQENTTYKGQYSCRTHECRDQRRSEQRSRPHNHQQPPTHPVLSAAVPSLKPRFTHLQRLNPGPAETKSWLGFFCRPLTSWLAFSSKHSHHGKELPQKPCLCLGSFPCLTDCTFLQLYLCKHTPFISNTCSHPT